MPGGWHILNPRRITDRLVDLAPADREAILGAIELLLENPYQPPGLTAHRMRGRALGAVDLGGPSSTRKRVTRPDEMLYIAHLPDHWYLTYTIHPSGIMPIAERLIRVWAFLRQEL